jgi:hypothetical protein
MSGMGWKLKCGIGTLSQGMHVFVFLRACRVSTSVVASQSNSIKIESSDA